jgi:TIR domain
LVNVVAFLNLSMKAHTRRPKVFISYSHADDELRRPLEAHLAQLRRQGLIESWWETDVESGQEWSLALRKALDSADVILVLISSAFLASASRWTPQISVMLESNQAPAAQIVPVILTTSDWADSPFKALRPLPENGKPVTSWPDQEAAWLDVQEGIRDLVTSRLPSEALAGSRAAVNGQRRAEPGSAEEEYAAMMASLPPHLVERVEFLIEKRDSTGQLSEDEEQELQQLAQTATDLATRHLSERLSDAGHR